MRRSFSHFPCSPYSWKGSFSVIKTRAFPLFIPHTIKGRRSRLSERFLYCWFRCRYWQLILWSIPLPARDDHIYMLRKCLPFIEPRKTQSSPSLSPIRSNKGVGLKIVPLLANKIKTCGLDLSKFLPVSLLASRLIRQDLTAGTSKARGWLRSGIYSRYSLEPSRQSVKSKPSRGELRK